jgi:hypothetical protein
MREIVEALRPGLASSVAAADFVALGLGYWTMLHGSHLPGIDERPATAGLRGRALGHADLSGVSMGAEVSPLPMANR